jgi:hypothetical protein
LGHRALIYSVRIHPKWKPNEEFEFGDLEGDGIYLGTVLHEIFNDNFLGSRDNKIVIGESAKLDGINLRTSFRSGDSGYGADIEDENHNLLLRQLPTHTQLLPCASLFRLPKNQKYGWWAVHENNGRSVKGLIESEMQKQLQIRHPDLKLVINPWVPSNVLTEALAHNRLESVRLFKYGAAPDFKDADQWMREEASPQIELRISARERAEKLVSGLAKSAAEGNKEALGKVIEFENLKFDMAKVEVELDNGSSRTFDLVGPPNGHPFAANIEPQETEGIPDDASLFDELGRVITEMQ